MGKAYQEESDSTFESDGVVYDLNKIFKAMDGKPIEEIEVSKLKWVLEFSKDMDVSRVKQADLTAPLLVTKYGQLELTVDGEHRLQRAVNEGVEKLPYSRVSTKIMSDAIIHPVNERLDIPTPSYLNW